MQAILAARLKVPVTKLPHRLGETVFDLSGGNPFWVKEVADYLTTYGVKVRPSPPIFYPSSISLASICQPSLWLVIILFTSPPTVH